MTRHSLARQQSNRATRDPDETATGSRRNRRRGASSREEVEEERVKRDARVIERANAKLEPLANLSAAPSPKLALCALSVPTFVFTSEETPRVNRPPSRLIHENRLDSHRADGAIFLTHACIVRSHPQASSDLTEAWFESMSSRFRSSESRSGSESRACSSSSS